MKDARFPATGITFRKPALAVFAWIGIAVLTSAFAAAAVIPKPSDGTFAAAIVFALFVYVIWLVGGHSAVRLGRDGVIVDNLLVRHVIPWGQLAEIGVGNGLVFVLRDGRRVGSIMYGGSVAGAILGYRYTRGAAARMRAARQELLAGSAEPPASGEYARRIGFSPWPPLAILALAEAIAALSLLAR